MLYYIIILLLLVVFYYSVYKTGVIDGDSDGYAKGLCNGGDVCVDMYKSGKIWRDGNTAVMSVAKQ